ncbi:uncharacterized protein LOC119097172 [Pollicipes pollicipes]|uniref:uncharacterized protein LOC119097172 n=1 Tax=Pollicipes pollicipes TaxID=41117 RepID=UPI0018851A5F|nr:uncharacterized protein LOC119097172 [Pollicipes pollicipes]
MGDAADLHRCLACSQTICGLKTYVAHREAGECAGSRSTAAGSGSTVTGSGSAAAGSGSTAAESGSAAAGSGSATAGSGSTAAESGPVAAGSGSATAGSGSTAAKSGSATAGSKSTAAGSGSSAAVSGTAIAGPRTTAAESGSAIAGPKSTTAADGSAPTGSGSAAASRHSSGGECSSSSAKRKSPPDKRSLPSAKRGCALVDCNAPSANLSSAPGDAKSSAAAGGSSVEDCRLRAQDHGATPGGSKPAASRGSSAVSSYSKLTHSVPGPSTASSRPSNLYTGPPAESKPRVLTPTPSTAASTSRNTVSKCLSKSAASSKLASATGSKSVILLLRNHKTGVSKSPPADRTALATYSKASTSKNNRPASPASSTIFVRGPPVRNTETTASNSSSAAPSPPSPKRTIRIIRRPPGSVSSVPGSQFVTSGAGPVTSSAVPPAASSAPLVSSVSCAPSTTASSPVPAASPGARPPRVTLGCRCEVCDLDFKSRTSYNEHVDLAHRSALQPTSSRAARKLDKRKAGLQVPTWVRAARAARLVEPGPDGEGFDEFGAVEEMLNVEARAPAARRARPAGAEEHDAEEAVPPECPLCGPVEEASTAAHIFSRPHVAAHRAAQAAAKQPDAAQLLALTLEGMMSAQTFAPYRCHPCRFSCNQLADLQRHTAAQGHWLRRCDKRCSLCATTVSGPEHFDSEVHRRWAGRVAIVSGVAYKCGECGAAFPLLFAARHSLCQYGGNTRLGQLQCRLCGFRNNLKVNVLFHESITHHPPHTGRKKTAGGGAAGGAAGGARPSKTLRYLCPHCDLYFRKASLKSHLMKHTGEAPFHCMYCSRYFYVESERDRHEVTSHRHSVRMHVTRVHRDEQRTCPADGCDYAATHASLMNRHIAVRHPDFRRFRCTQCAFSCSTAVTLDTHVNMHSGLKPYQCPHCSFATRFPPHLKRHLRIHTGARPYPCPFCEYKANNFENLRKHVITTRRHQGLRVYMCKFCPEGALFGTNYARQFKQHLREKHAGQFETVGALATYVAGLYNREEDIIQTDTPIDHTYKIRCSG